MTTSPARPAGLRRPVGRHRPSDRRRHGADRRGRPRRRRPAAAVLRERDQHGPAVRRRPGHALSQGRHQRPRDPRRGHGQPRAGRHQVRVLVPGSPCRAGQTVELRLRLRPAGGSGRGSRGGRARRRVRPGDGRSAGPRPTSSTPSSPRPAPAPTRRWCCGRRAPGMLWSKQLFYYDVDPLAGRRPGPAGAAGRAQERAELQVAQLRRVRHHLDAGQVGVSLVRRLGPGLPQRHAGPPGPGVRQVPADHGLPGVVPAPERGAAGL